MQKDKKILICTPQFDRTYKLDFPVVPNNETEFYDTINNAPLDILKGMGFGKWDSWNNIVSENKKERPSMVVMPMFKPDELAGVLSGDIVRTEQTMMLDLSPKHELPTDLKEENVWILLFPYEWYKAIPNNFMVTGLHGEQYPFEKGKTDDDQRFGCLAYGIVRNLTPILNSDKNPERGVTTEAQ